MPALETTVSRLISLIIEVAIHHDLVDRATLNHGWLAGYIATTDVSSLLGIITDKICLLGHVGAVLSPFGSVWVRSRGLELVAI